MLRRIENHFTKPSSLLTNDDLESWLSDKYGPDWNTLYDPYNEDWLVSEVFLDPPPIARDPLARDIKELLKLRHSGARLSRKDLKKFIIQQTDKLKELVPEITRLEQRLNRWEVSANKPSTPDYDRLRSAYNERKVRLQTAQSRQTTMQAIIDQIELMLQR